MGQVPSHVMVGTSNVKTGHIPASFGVVTSMMGTVWDLMAQVMLLLQEEVEGIWIMVRAEIAKNKRRITC